MAVTFKDFFIGLSESAPVVAQLVHDYTIWQYQQGMEERRMGLAERQGEADIQRNKDIGEYYKSQTDIERKKFGLEEREFDALFQSKVDKANAEEETARRARDLQKFETNIITMPFESLTPEEKTAKLNIMKDRQIRNDEIIARINQHITSASTDKAREVAIKEEAEMKKIKSLNDHMDLFEGWIMDKKQIPKFEKLISSLLLY